MYVYVHAHMYTILNSWVMFTIEQGKGLQNAYFLGDPQGSLPPDILYS